MINQKHERMHHMKKTVPINAEGLVFSAQDFSNQSFGEHAFTMCVFEKCDFSNSSFEQASLWNCTFKACNLTMVNVKGSRLQDVAFFDSKLVGINFAQCDSSLFFSIFVTKSLLQYCNFSALAMEDASFKESRLLECKFVDTTLKKANFEDVELAGTMFQNCDMREANFLGAVNYRINPCENRISKAKFSFPECIGLIKPLDIIIED